MLPDGLAGQVIRDDFTPRFKEGDYSGGIRNGVTHLVEIVEKHQVLTPEETREAQRAGNATTCRTLIVIPFFGLFVTIGFGMLGIGLRTKTGFPVLFGSLFGGMPLLMSLAFMGKVSLFTLCPWAIVVFILGLPAWRPASRGAMRFANGGKGGSGSSRAGRWARRVQAVRAVQVVQVGSSSSFGGGSSGGGGASGRW